MRKSGYTICFFYLLLLLSAAGKGQAPSANFIASQVSGCSPLIVSYQDLSVGNPTQWNWNFGNGNSSTLQHPTATYFTPGTYTVTLTVTNAAGSHTLTRSQYITVFENPIVNFSGTPMSGCFPLRVQFMDLSSAGSGTTNIVWFWDFGNGNTSTQQNPLNTYTSTGTFSVTLRVTNDQGCSKVFTRTNYISVTNGVSAGFSHSSPTVCRAPALINFINSSSGPPVLSYFWDFGDGNNSTLQDPVHNYLSNGSYTVTLVTTSTAGCVDTARQTITIGGITTSFSAPPQVCVNQVASFTNTSAPVPVSTLWNFGDGGTASGINTSHIYSTPGSYVVSMYNTYSGCTDSAFQIINVQANPVAAFTAPVTSRCQPPLVVNFQDLSSGGATNWQWDFGDGNSSSLQHPTHTYTSYGSFTVRLIVTNGAGCSDTITIPDLVIIRRAIISIPGLPVRGCIPFTFAFNPSISSVDAVTSYNWNFGDGGTSALPNPVYTYNSQGTYTVRLIITTSTGCSDTLIVPQAVRVGSKPVAAFSASPIPVCAHQPVQFTDFSAPADEWNWDFGDGGTSNLQNPEHRYNDTGYFDIRLIVFNNGCPDTLVRTNYVRVLPPVAQFNSTPDCSNRLRFSFTDVSVAPLTWDWDFGDGSTSSAQNPVHIFSALGTYSVRLIVTNGGCADTIFHTVQALDEIPEIVADFITACRVVTVPFHATGINPANITNYFWDFGDGTTANSAVPDITHTYTNAGTYTISLTITDLNGCTSSRTRTNYLRINGPVSDFSGSNVTGCTGLTSTFNDLSFTDGVHPIVNWQFDFGDGTVQNFSAPPFLHIYSSTGMFSVKLVVTDASGCKDSITRANIVTTTDPVPDFSSSDTLTCPGAPVQFNNASAPSGLLYLWDFGDGNSSVHTNPAHTYTAAGIYTVKLRVQDVYGCTDSLVRTDYIQVRLPVADFTTNDSISSCIPFNVTFTNTSFFYNSSFWDFGSGQGTSTQQHTSHYFSAPGIYPIKLVVTSPGGCKDSIIKNIYVYDSIGARVSYTPNGGCKPLPVSLNIISNGPMDSYFWDFGDGNTMLSATPGITHTYNNFGDFLPKVILTDPAGCIIPLEASDTVFVIGATTKFGYDDSIFCDAGLVHFTDSTTFNDTITQYHWSFGDGGQSSLQNPSHYYNVPGLYTVQLDVETRSGCRDTLSKQNLIAVVQRPLIRISGDSVLCIHSSLDHTGLFIQPDTSVVTWYWSFPNGTTYSMQDPPAQTYHSAGLFPLTAIATNSSGCRDTSLLQIRVNPLPAVTMPSQLSIQNGYPITVPATYSSNTINWQWSPSTGLSCTLCPTPQAGPKSDTYYQVFFTDDNRCSNGAGLLVKVFCKNANLFIPNTFSPNGDGSNDIFYLRGRGLERVKLLRIFNRWGEVVFEKRDVPVNDPSAGWNGSFKGKKPMADVYIYQAEVFCENGELIRMNGNVSLLF